MSTFTDWTVETEPATSYFDGECSIQLRSFKSSNTRGHNNYYSCAFQALFHLMNYFLCIKMKYDIFHIQPLYLQLAKTINWQFKATKKWFFLTNFLLKRMLLIMLDFWMWTFLQERFKPEFQFPPKLLFQEVLSF